MNAEQLKQFCAFFHAANFVPIFLYKEEDAADFSCTAIPDFAPTHYVRKNLAGEPNPTCFFSSETGMWGRIYVPDADCSVIYGPAFSGEITSEMLPGFLNWHGFPVARKDEIGEYLRSIPKYSYYRFLNMLAFLHYTLNGEAIDIIDHFDRERGPYDERISAAQTEEAVTVMEEAGQHGTYEVEQRIIDLVRSGDVEKLKAYLNGILKTEKLREGKLAESPIRQAKNIFIGAATLFGKSGAIRGELDVEETYQLIDIYIQECERLSRVEDITVLQYNMLIDFTSRVAENKIPEGISEDIYAAIQFIGNHTNEWIGINEVAAHIGKSRAYLTDKFKRETGKTVNDYILNKKLSESRHLLKHTNKTIAEIACFLCFSSQNYFQTLFKHKYGETPSAYRKRLAKS